MALQEEHDFDNTPFLNALESRGFILGSDVHTPYNQTLLVTAAVFNGAYLDPSQYPLTETKPDRMRMALGNTVHEGPFIQRLAELGYSFLSAGSGYYFFRPANEETLSEPNLGFFSLNGFEDFLTGRILAAFPDELSALIQESSFVVCPYKDATQSGVVMSAYALKKPVIATRVGGLVEMVEDKKTGLLVSITVKRPGHCTELF